MASRRVLAMTALVGMALASRTLNEKRGLAFVPEPDHPDDNDLWHGDESVLSWYYNWQDRPSPAYSDVSQSDFEFVPMMWGVNDDDLEDTAFLDQVRRMIDDDVNITHVLGFNEPDAPFSWGGSDVVPRDAARAWVANFEPLGEMGIKLGLPGCTGGWESFPWLKQFLGNCSEILSDGGDEKNCTFDFIPVHWYDNIEGLKSHIGERLSEWPNTSIWITEWSLAHQDLQATKDHYQEVIDYFDGNSSIGRYSYFGAFRSENSNVGPDASLLNNDGDLTDIGSWYLGGDATGVDPQSGLASRDAMSVWGVVVAGIAGLSIFGLL